MEQKKEGLVKLRVGGVPEHFNYPWHLAIERNLFAKYGVEVEWVEIKLGTGILPLLSFSLYFETDTFIILIQTAFLIHF